MQLDGPWRDEGEVRLTTNKSNAWITNPCVLPPPANATDESTYMLYRQAGTSWPASAPGTRERLGWAVGEHCPSAINCSYADRTEWAPLLNETLEDQYLWRDHRGHFHAITHKNPAGGVSSHLWSGDGLRWRTSPVAPYTDTIALEGGRSYTCGKRARPMLIVEGGRPRYLSTGASYAEAEHGGDHTFTTMQQVRGGA